ncbi:hypothetical protein CN165_12730 [Sinorhizobium medicae]|uniref:hypothetical protein n=1 Tax=Sinorhizobium medicae TaxID=110321 RepID=UPI000FD832D0|nr:hypothetical protein [Sinorhizobium medicae]RVK19427.1 hypothetical protein CN165_12730 [Sinorhizobium medicae]
MKDIKILDKAQAAKRLQENPDFRLIMDCIESDIFTTFKNVNIGETEKLENVHALSHGYKLVNNQIAKYIELALFEARKNELSDD